MTSAAIKHMYLQVAVFDWLRLVAGASLTIIGTSPGSSGPLLSTSPAVFCKLPGALNLKRSLDCGCCLGFTLFRSLTKGPVQDVWDLTETGTHTNAGAASECRQKFL